MNNISESIEKFSILIVNNRISFNELWKEIDSIDPLTWIAYRVHRFSFLVLRMGENESMRYIVEHSVKPTIKCIHASQIAYFRNKQWQSAAMHSSELHMFGHL